MTVVGRTYIASAIVPGISTGTANAHQTGQVVGSAFQLPLAGGWDGGAVAYNFQVIDRSTANAAYALFLFNAPPTHQADKTVFDLATAGLNKYLGVMRLETSDYVSAGIQSVGKSVDQATPVRASGGGRDVYGVLVNRSSGVSYMTASALTVLLGLLQD